MAHEWLLRRLVTMKILHIGKWDDGIEGATIGLTRCRVVGVLPGAHTPRFVYVLTLTRDRRIKPRQVTRLFHPSHGHEFP
jgi:hypothetical protein